MSFFSDSAPSINNDTGQPANNLFQQRLQRIKKTDIREDSSHWEQSFLGDNPIGTVMEKIFPDSHSESDIRTEQIKQTPYSELEPRNTPTLNASDTPKPWVNMYDVGYQVRAKLETLDRKMNELHQKQSTCNQRCITLEQLLTNEMVQIVTQIHSSLSSDCLPGAIQNLSLDIEIEQLEESTLKRYKRIPSERRKLWIDEASLGDNI